MLPYKCITADICRYKYVYVEARNADVKRKVLEKYRPFAGNSSISVFCIGNEDYDMGGDNFSDSETRNILVPGSGIPELRHFCHSVVARSQFRVSDHFLEVEINDLVQSLEVWMASVEQGALPLIPLDCVPKLQAVSLAFTTGLTIF